MVIGGLVEVAALGAAATVQKPTQPPYDVSARHAGIREPMTRQTPRIAGTMIAALVLLVGAGFGVVQAGPRAADYGTERESGSASGNNSSEPSGVDISPEQQHKNVKPGGSVTYTFNLTNYGPSARRVEIATNASSGSGPGVGNWSHKVSATEFHLLPGASAKLDVLVQAPTVTTELSYTVQVKVLDASSRAVLDKAFATSHYSLLP